MNDSFVDELQETHIAAWNEKDATKRVDLLKRIYSENIRMYDKDAVFQGMQEISDFIGKLLSEDPAFNFTAVKPIEQLHNSARLAGRIVTGRGILDSMDFFLIENGKVEHLYAFLTPAA